jgi:hypothetical protein
MFETYTRERTVSTAMSAPRLPSGSAVVCPNAKIAGSSLAPPSLETAMFVPFGTA